MKLPVRHDARRSLKFNITPLIDVVFLLIIFFLVASHFVRNETSAAIDLPMATKGQKDTDQQASRLTISIRENGDMLIAGQAVSQSEVMNRIQALANESQTRQTVAEVRLRGHRDAKYGAMRKLIEASAANGIRALKFAVQDAP